MKKMKFMLILCLFAAALQGGVVTLINPSFEDDGAVNGSGQAWTDYDITGWFDTTATPIGKDRGNVTQTPYGDHLCDIQGVGTNIGQEIGDTTLIGKTVEVSYIVTRRTNETLETDHYVRIIAGTSVTYIGGIV